MGTHRLPNGREVYLVRFKMVGTYSGHFEGSAKTISQYVRETLPERAANVLAPARPLAVVPPPAGELPQWLCVAELESRHGVQHKDPDYNSRLYACWFVEDTARGIDEMVEASLHHLDWEHAAEDYDIMDF